MVLLERDNLVADHIHGDKDSFFILGDLDRVNSNMCCNSGASLLIVDFALLDEDRDAILHGATEAKGASNKVAEVGNVGHKERTGIGAMVGTSHGVGRRRHCGEARFGRGAVGRGAVGSGHVLLVGMLGAAGGSAQAIKSFGDGRSSLQERRRL